MLTFAVIFHRSRGSCWSGITTTRFIQMWYIPSEPRLEPAVQQKQVERPDRTNHFLPLVSNANTEALPIRSPAEVYACYLETNHQADFAPREGWGVYLYVPEGGPIDLNGQTIDTLGAAMIEQERELHVSSQMDAELLLVHVQLT